MSTHSLAALFVLSAAVIVVPSVLSAELKARVRQTLGGPQIFADGKPIPPRMFWGNPTGGTVSVNAEWAEKSFDFSPGADAVKTGTMHFRFGKQAGEVWLSDLRIVETATGADVMTPGSLADPETFSKVWRVWPPDKENTVGKLEIEAGVLRVKIANPPGGAWPDFHLYSGDSPTFRAGVSYRCSFKARAVPPRHITPCVYRAEHGSWSRIGSPPGQFLEQIAMARDAGVDLVSFGAPSCWSPPDRETNWSPLDDLCRSIIAVNPRVLLLPRVGCDAPGWWLTEHPDAHMLYEGDQRGKKASVSHRQYRADAAAHLEKLCRHLAETFPDRFAGVHPCGQNTGEWFYEDTWRQPLNGYEPATLKAWREWRRARGDAEADRAEVPDPASRHAAPNGVLRDPATERRLIDFALFQQEEMADMVNALAAAARRGVGPDRLVVFFYGYHYEFGAVANGAPVSGHYALRKALGSPAIDIVCSPISYTDRRWLETGPVMTSAESVQLSGKMWLNEDDTRTHLDTRPAAQTQEGGLVNLEQTQQIMLRNTAQAALRGFGTWWMDLPGAGWFADPAIWTVMKRLRPVDDAMLSRPRPFTPEIASILDEDSMCHLAGGSHVAARPLVYESRAALGRCGAPYGQYMLDDVLAGKVPAKLQIFLAAWALTPEQRRALTERRPAGLTRVWCYAPGYILPDRADAAAMRDVTGFAHRTVSPPNAVVTPTEAGKTFGLTEPWGLQKAVRPLFAVEAEPSEILATYADGSAAVAMRKREGGADVFVGVPKLTPELVRGLAKAAGAHLYATVDAAVWAADPYLSIHVMKDGPLTVFTGRDQAVSNALDGAPVGRGPELKLDVRAGDTLVLRY